MGARGPADRESHDEGWAQRLLGFLAAGEEVGSSRGPRGGGEASLREKDDEPRLLRFLQGGARVKRGFEPVAELS